VTIINKNIQRIAFFEKVTFALNVNISCTFSSTWRSITIEEATTVPWAWGSVVVKALLYWSGGLGIDPQWCHWGFFPRLPTGPCALGFTQRLKMSTRKTPGGKDGRCVRLRPYHLHRAESRVNPEALTSSIFKGRLGPITGKLYLFTQRLKDMNLLHLVVYFNVSYFFIVWMGN
jgi:hypothetical protein